MFFRMERSAVSAGPPILSADLAMADAKPPAINLGDVRGPQLIE